MKDFVRRCAAGILTGLVLCAAIHTWRPSTQADVDLAKIEAQSKLDVLALQQKNSVEILNARMQAQYAEDTLRGNATVRRADCFQKVVAALGPQFVHENVGKADDMLTRNCQ